MTLPTGGAISMAGIRAELGVGGPVDLNRSDVRGLAGVSSGAIALSDFYGKTGPANPDEMTVTGSGAAKVGQANGITAFTAQAYPDVSVTGGLAPFTYAWTITVQDDNGFTLSNANQATCTVSHSIGKYGYIGQCSLSCSVSDSAGQTKTVSGLVAYFDYQYGIIR